jgi:hypothetical protein
VTKKTKLILKPVVNTKNIFFFAIGALTKLVCDVFLTKSYIGGLLEESTLSLDTFGYLLGTSPQWVYFVGATHDQD